MSPLKVCIPWMAIWRRLMEITALCKKYAALLIVDEAHAFGVFGKGLVHSLGLTG